MSRGLGNKPCTEAQLEQAIGPSWDCSTEEYCREQSISFGALPAMVSMASSVALADRSCSTWNWQREGVYWQTCVNDDGSQECFQATDGNGANQMKVAC